MTSGVSSHQDFPRWDDLYFCCFSWAGGLTLTVVCLSLLQVTSSMATKAETDTLHEPTWQVRACRHTLRSALPLIVALPLFQILRLPSHWHRLRAQPALGVQAFTIYGACVCFAVCVFYTVVEKDDPLARGLYIPCPDHYKNYCVHGDCQFPNILAQPSCRYTQIGTWRNLRINPFLNTKTSKTWQLLLFNFWGREPTTRVNQSYTLCI